MHGCVSPNTIDEHNLADRPVHVSLEAMNPAVPGDAESSSIPVALFRFTVQNRGDKPVEASLSM